MGVLTVVSSIVQGNGAKYVTANTAYETAKLLSRKQRNRVLLIDFDMDCPTLGMSLYEYRKQEYLNKNFGIDEVLSKSNLNILNEESFFDTCLKIDLGAKNQSSLYILRGTMTPGRYKNHNEESVRKILFYAKKIFDFVFVVANSRYNNAGFIYSMQEADNLILVAKNNHSNIIRADGVLLALNQYYSSKNPKYILYNHGSNPNCNISEKFSQLNMINVGLLDYDEREIDNEGLMKKSIFSSRPNSSVFVKLAKKIISEEKQTDV